jgi:hypothetical protein
LTGQGAVLRNGTARTVDPVGISLEGGGGHTVHGIEVATPFAAGMRVSSDHNRLLKNRAISDGIGFDVDGSHNLLANNIGVGQVGFSVGGQANLLFQNSDAFELMFGFLISGDQNLLVSNQTSNGGNRGFGIAGAGNKLVGNMVTGYLQEGIRVSGGQNVMVRNTAQNNGTDLVDTHEDCDGNQWHQNVFQTSLAGSIENPACIR